MLNIPDYVMTIGMQGTLLPERWLVYVLNHYQERDHDPFPQILLLRKSGHTTDFVGIMSAVGFPSCRGGCHFVGLPSRVDGNSSQRMFVC